MRSGCPCCGYLTLTRLAGGTDEVCEVCFWEDDGVQFRDPGYEGGANKVSLTEARENFRRFGACEREVLPHVRPPRPDEQP